MTKFNIFGNATLRGHVTSCFKNAPTLASCSFDKHIQTYFDFFINSISTLSKMICLFNFSCHFIVIYFIILFVF